MVQGADNDDPTWEETSKQDHFHVVLSDTGMPSFFLRSWNQVLFLATSASLLRNRLLSAQTAIECAKRETTISCEKGAFNPFSVLSQCRENNALIDHRFAFSSKLSIQRLVLEICLASQSRSGTKNQKLRFKKFLPKILILCS